MEPNQQDVQEQILTPKQCKHGNLMYIIEAAVEYFITLLITGSTSDINHAVFGDFVKCSIRWPNRRTPTKITCFIVVEILTRGTM